MPADKIRNQDSDQRKATITNKSWKVMLVLMLVFIPVNFLLPCGCVLREADPRQAVLLMIAGSWVYHLICCARERRHSAFWRGTLLGFFFFVFAFLTMPV